MEDLTLNNYSSENLKSINKTVCGERGSVYFTSLEEGEIIPLKLCVRSIFKTGSFRTIYGARNLISHNIWLQTLSNPNSEVKYK
jgi:hypothetical protein